jgi:hypothetical protein
MYELGPYNEKTAFFIVTAVKTSDPTQSVFIFFFATT